MNVKASWWLKTITGEKNKKNKFKLIKSRKSSIIQMKKSLNMNILDKFNLEKINKNNN